MSVNGDTGEVQSNVEDMATKYRDTHLDADEALNCVVALAYFVKAFGTLSEADRQEWVATWSAEHRFELGSLLISYGVGEYWPFYLAMDEAEIDGPEIEVTLSALNESLAGTPFNNKDYRNSYQMHYSEPLRELQANQ